MMGKTSHKATQIYDVHALHQNDDRELFIV